MAGLDLEAMLPQTLFVCLDQFPAVLLAVLYYALVPHSLGVRTSTAWLQFLLLTIRTLLSSRCLAREGGTVGASAVVPPDHYMPHLLCSALPCWGSGLELDKVSESIGCC